MNDLVEIGHLTKYDAFRMNQDQAVNFEIWFKIHTNVSNFAILQVNFEKNSEFPIGKFPSHVLSRNMIMFQFLCYYLSSGHLREVMTCTRGSQ